MMKRQQRWASWLGLCVVCMACTACGHIEGPKPWEKGLLARPEMTMGGDALEAKYDQHTYGSKEASSGGYGVGGGGCGCN
jgi:hypothetical protein